MNKFFIYLIFAFILSGCSTIKNKEVEKEIVIKTKNVLITPPVEMMVQCQKIEPPPKDIYLQSNYRDKEELLVNLTIKLYAEIDICNTVIKSIIDWTEKQKAIYKE